MMQGEQQEATFRNVLEEIRRLTNLCEPESSSLIPRCNVKFSGSSRIASFRKYVQPQVLAELFALGGTQTRRADKHEEYTTTQPYGAMLAELLPLKEFWKKQTQVCMEIKNRPFLKVFSFMMMRKPSCCRID